MGDPALLDRAYGCEIAVEPRSVAISKEPECQGAGRRFQSDGSSPQRRSLRALEQSLARLAAQVREINRSNAAGPKGKPRRKLKLMPARLKALRLHGRYLGYMRQLKSRAKAEVRALRAKKGVRAAIARARKLATVSSRP